jgi:hypothetical protein
MHKRNTAWSRFLNQFRRRPSLRIIEGDPSSELEAEMDTVWQRDSSKLEEAWDRVRKLVNRGNAAGAIASLTLFGSQQLGGRDPHEREFVTLCLFIVGLGSLLTRELVVVWHLHYQRKENVSAVPEWDAFNPAPIIMKFARLLDWISIILLITGICFGLYVLYSLTQLRL